MTTREYTAVSTAERAQGFAAALVVVAAGAVLQGCGEAEARVAVGVGFLGCGVSLCLVAMWLASAFFGPGCDRGQVDDEPRSPGFSAVGGGT